MIVSATQIKKISHCSQECGLTVCIMPGFCTELQLVRSGEKKGNMQEKATAIITRLGATP